MVLSVMTANKQLVTRFIGLLNAGAHDEAVALLTDDFIWSIPESIPGGGEKSAAEFREMLTSVMALYESQPQYTIVSMTAESDRVSAELVGVGDLRNGNRFHNRYHMLFFLSDASIRRVNEYVDTHYSIKNIFGG
jgi:ketosteroid isomerase-like protein